MSCNHSAACLPVACLFVCLFVGLLYSALLSLLPPSLCPSPLFPCHCLLALHPFGLSLSIVAYLWGAVTSWKPIPYLAPLCSPSPLRLASKLKLTRNPIGVLWVQLSASTGGGAIESVSIFNKKRPIYGRTHNFYNSYTVISMGWQLFVAIVINIKSKTNSLNCSFKAIFSTQYAIKRIRYPTE